MGGCGYQNEEYSAIAARCYALADLTERKAAYAELQKMFREEYVSIGLYTSKTFVLTRPGIENIELWGLGLTNFSNIYGD
jgi:ABC-type transport system substrate-binding protein